MGVPEGHSWTRLRRTEEHSLYLKRKDIPTHGEKPSTGCVASLSFAKDAFQAQSPLLRVQIGLKDDVYETAFPNVVYRISCLSVESEGKNDSTVFK